MPRDTTVTPVTIKTKHFVQILVASKLPNHYLQFILKSTTSLQIDGDPFLNSREVFETVAKSGLKLNELKCEICKSKICLFGTLSSAIKERSLPHNVSQLLQVLGTINYLERFL